MSDKLQLVVSIGTRNRDFHADCVFPILADKLKHVVHHMSDKLQLVAAIGTRNRDFPADCVFPILADKLKHVGHWFGAKVVNQILAAIVPSVVFPISH